MAVKYDEERDAILSVIQKECLAFFSRDFQGWSKTWMQSDASRRLGTAAGGQLVYHDSWSATASKVAGFMEQFPEPNPQGALSLRKDNFSFRITKEMAWVSFDQYGQDTGDPFDSIGLSHQIRILEKHDGEWKIAFIGHGESSIGYFPFPVVRVDVNASIQWMNEAARQNLITHATLIDMGGRLRARRREDDKNLREALAQAVGFSEITLRQSMVSPSEHPSKIPVTLSVDTGEITDLCWVSVQDNMLLVSFSDTGAEKERLEVAAKLYNLSPSQVLLAEFIVAGQDVVSAAKALNISATTARTQLNRMFEKTGTRSQTGLVRTLFSAGAPTL